MTATGRAAARGCGLPAGPRVLTIPPRARFARCGRSRVHLWTDGVKGRKDGFVYLRQTLALMGSIRRPPDGEELPPCYLDFFKSDPAGEAP